MEPLISIIIPTYNRDEFIRETLDSIKNQIYKNWECIIVDDGSKDESLQTVDEYCRKDPRFKFYQRPANIKKGASACRNFGLKKAVGQWIQFLDSDDLLGEAKISEQIKYRAGEKTLLTCRWGGFTSFKDLKSRFKYRYYSYRNFKKGTSLLNTFGLYNEYFPSHVYLIPRELINEAGAWDETLSNNDDAEFFTRIILKSFRIVFVPDSIVYYRYHSSNSLSSLDSEKKLESAITSWKLIEKHIKEDNSGNSLKYVKRAKANLFDHIKTKNPQILLKYPEFFSDRNNYDSIYYKYMKKLNQLF